MVARGYIIMLHIPSKWNFADILTKHWGYQGTYLTTIQPVFHHEGNIIVLFFDDALEVDTSIPEGRDMVFRILGSDKTLCQPQQESTVLD